MLGNIISYNHLDIILDVTSTTSQYLTFYLVSVLYKQDAELRSFKIKESEAKMLSEDFTVNVPLLLIILIWFLFVVGMRIVTKRFFVPLFASEDCRKDIDKGMLLFNIIATVVAAISAVGVILS